MVYLGTYSSCLWSLAYRKPSALDKHDDAHNPADETHVVEEHTQLARIRPAAKVHTVHDWDGIIHSSVTDPGSGAFFTPESGMGKKSGSGTIFWG